LKGGRDSRDGAITFRGIVGKSTCSTSSDKCGRRGRYHLHHLVERHGIDAKSDEAGLLAARRRGLPIQQVAASGPVTPNAQIMSVFVSPMANPQSLRFGACCVQVFSTELALTKILPERVAKPTRSRPLE